MNHADIVERIKNEGGDFSTPDGMLAVLLRIIGALPREERGGLLRKDAGENIAWYAPRQCNVSISRVCYPDGQIYKVFTDAGPGGTNGPAWNDDGFVEVSRYLEIVSTQPIPEPVPVPTPCHCDMAAMQAALDAVRASVIALGQELDQLDKDIEQRDDDLFAAFASLTTLLQDIHARQDRRYTGNTKAFGGRLELTPQ